MGEERGARKSKKPEFTVVAEEEGVAAEVPLEEADAAAEGDEAIAPEADETFLEEEEEDGGDVSNIIGGPMAEDEDEV